MTAEAEETLKRVFKRSKRIVVVAGKIYGYLGALFSHNLCKVLGYRQVLGFLTIDQPKDCSVH